jgi:serine kinase of HPr protein (carbohydrate metabolism regulator)
VVGETGILIRGGSGSGKSSLTRQILFHAGQAGRFARLVSDDRARVTAMNGRVVAFPVEPVSGCMEIRGIGIVRQPFEPAAVVRLIIDLSDDPPRYPELQDATVEICGVLLPRIHARAGAFSADIALGHLSGLCDTVMTL